MSKGSIIIPDTSAPPKPRYVCLSHEKFVDEPTSEACRKACRGGGRILLPCRFGNVAHVEDVLSQPRRPVRTRVFQTMLGPAGNCHAACVSFLTGIPLSEVPNFNDFDHISGRQFWNAHHEREWMKAHGYANQRFCPPAYPQGECIGIIKSPREGNHAVVIDGLSIVHDPMPGAEIIAEPQFLEFEVLIPVRWSY